MACLAKSTVYQIFRRPSCHPSPQARCLGSTHNKLISLQTAANHHSSNGRHRHRCRHRYLLKTLLNKSKKGSQLSKHPQRQKSKQGSRKQNKKLGFRYLRTSPSKKLCRMKKSGRIYQSRLTLCF